MYKKILVPLDRSKRAEKILPHVEDLASHYKAEVILLMTIPHFQAAAVDGSFVEFSEKDFNTQLEKAKFYLKDVVDNFRQKDIGASILVTKGPAVENIIQTAEKEDVGLIAMTSHGRGGLSRVFYGSVASGVLNRADRPLLIVRARQEV
jgi:nucleotide-binding universal stress UspA family protein